jgi:hypothetical protein
MADPKFDKNKNLFYNLKELGKIKKGKSSKDILKNLNKDKTTNKKDTVMKVKPINITATSFVPGTMKGEPIPTTRGPNFSTNKVPLKVPSKVNSTGSIKVKPGNIGGVTTFSQPQDIHQGKRVMDLKKGTGKGNAYYPEERKKIDSLRKQRMTPKTEPRRIHEATRMAQSLLKRPTKLK